MYQNCDTLSLDCYWLVIRAKQARGKIGDTVNYGGRDAGQTEDDAPDTGTGFVRCELRWHVPHWDGEHTHPCGRLKEYSDVGPW